MSEASTIQPDPTAMLRHVELVFGGGFDGALDGLVELAWTDPATGSLRNAQMFGTDQLEELVECAAELNRTERCNVYVGAALRKPGTALAKRTADSDFHSAPFAWADIDDDCVEAAIKAAKAAGVPATMTVVTGRHPHMRAQFWWRLVDAERDGAAIKALCSSIGLALGGDSTVSNPGRVLRLGGSIAWPLKPGRVEEATEVHIPEDDRPPAYWASALAQAFAAPAPLFQNAPPASEPSAPSMAPPTPKPLELPIGSLSVEATLAAIQRNDHWHQNTVRLVGNWVARGLSNAEILSFAPALTIGSAADGRSYTPEQTRLQLNSMITGARRKWNLPNPVVTIDDKLPPPPIEIEWEDGASAAMIPRRRWLVGSFAIRGHLTVLVAPPGAGKSTLGIALAVAGVTGRGEIVGETVHETIKAWVWNNEDDRNELRRRLAAIMQQWNVAPADLYGKLGLNSGSERPLVIAKATKDGAVVRLPDIEAIIERVRLEGIGLLIVDPFVETHEVDENNNAQIKAVAAMWREVARRGDCAVVIVHHTGKPPSASPDAWTGSLSASRGASSLGGVARIMRTLFAMSQSDADKFGLDADERRLWVRLDDAKANLSLASGSARWFKRVSIIIANGEEVGALVPGDPAARNDERDFDPALDARVEAAIERHWSDGTPLSERPEARDRFAQAILSRELGASADAIRDAIVRLQRAGAVLTETFCQRTKKKGLRVVPFDERITQGDVA
ncbi:MAG: AAA family ATPase [Methylocystis sp.]|nr:AAA family ATPase [Methylocystis sp.]MCA3586999.1 AAA family ATPase [Methylocystis sp.]MCA3591290.1 AAA family ATPase [Methylocystis sp.]